MSSETPIPTPGPTAGGPAAAPQPEPALPGMPGGAAARPHADENFGQDFRRFFLRGLAALMPTLITVLLMIKVWEFLWESLGRYLILGVDRVARATSDSLPASAWINRHAEWFRETGRYPNIFSPPWFIQLAGVALALILIYGVGLFVGNFIGRTAWRLAEAAVMRIPLIRAVYPAVKQVTDFVLAEKRHILGSRVVAVEPHAKGIWSIGLVTGPGLKPLTAAVGKEMLTVFIPSSPTAFTGYVLVVPRESVVELPLSVEQAMRLLISGGVIDPAAASLLGGLRAKPRPLEAPVGATVTPAPVDV